ncbi:hypothetical protein L873DRAFT_1818271 [Choiromyces venosus 120613-1]|uniref:Uncharacterized protein n=1 Tax=Choiromyces venosus 120613-1 TaxID=1336337 RepID=A0A3N4J160_9PEZI|nr:hypothetical protein L873DRAFT_1818271 [Choiromyces venosus 120613-1]
MHNRPIAQSPTTHKTRNRDLDLSSETIKTSPESTLLSPKSTSRQVSSIQSWCYMQTKSCLQTSENYE